MNYISHLMDDDSMKKLVSETGMGIESIEFSIAQNLDHLEQTLKSYEKRLVKMGTSSLTIHGPFLDLNPMAFDSLVQQATMTRYNQAYEAACTLGAKKIIFHAGYIPSVYFLEGWAERMAEFYNRFLEDKTADIQILMENVLDPYPEPLREVAEQVKHPAFGICLDVGHAHCYSQAGKKKANMEDDTDTGDYADISNRADEAAQPNTGVQNRAVQRWICVLKPYIRHLHLHDNCGDRDSHLAVGQGTVSWSDVQHLLERGVEYTLECRTAEDAAESQKHLVHMVKS